MIIVIRKDTRNFSSDSLFEILTEVQMKVLWKADSTRNYMIAINSA